MDIQKFYTNSKLALNFLDKDRFLTKVTFIDIDYEKEASKVLGMVYSAKTDTFSYVSKFKTVKDFVISKRLKPDFHWS